MKKIVASILITLTTLTSYVHAKIVVIANPAGPDKLTKAQVKKIYLGKSKKLGGKKVEAINLKSGQETRNQFLSGVVGKNANQYKSYWARRVFTGKGKPPKEVGSESAVVSYVASHKNAIGFVDESKVTSKVKIVYR
ncbi:hypothetical protein [Piscirickettsia litoralis]|uniref:hypothetical protein n=1 Tax=Piscirickettsia litoralis TaxID=1891921 RepID=UPI001911DA4B|nr:hypothetical protein [Piscirickettsia litoralis]